MDNNLIYTNVNKNLSESSSYQKIIYSLFEEFEKSNISEDDIYILDKPIMDSSIYQYEYEYGFFVLVKNHKILFFNTGDESDDFDEYVADVLEDIGSLSRKFNYVNLIGRARTWEKKLTKVFSSNAFDNNTILKDTDLDVKLSRKSNLIISLCTGSINNIDNLDKQLLEKDNITLLEAVNNRIMLFDTNQTKFVYNEQNKKVTRIQGLAGAGKTELLLHKLRKLYVEDKESKIAISCFNKVLADNLKSRIPKFFNYMKVDEQIDYTRLFISSSWGSKNDPTSGLYSRICSHYNLNFQRYNKEKPNKEVWIDAIKELELRKNIEPLFDYILLDESQDFDDEYFRLCDLVTSKKVYIAGDVLQNIFSINRQLETTQADYILNKVYRTDPRTILFSHILGFGLYESKAVRWLKDTEWKMSGYNVTQINDTEKFQLKREFIDRFEEDKLGFTFPSIVIKEYENSEYCSEVLEIIDDIRSNHPLIKPKDIAIVFSNYSAATRMQAKNLGHLIFQKYSWNNVLVPEEKRTNEDDEITITNVNNVKGLEFSFVIIINNQEIQPISDTNVSKEIRKRNALYMSLTRSFITSYLVMSRDTVPDQYINKLEQLASSLAEGDASTIVTRPTSIISESELYSIDNSKIKSQYEIIEECLNERELIGEQRKRIRDHLDLHPAIQEGLIEKAKILSLIDQFVSIR